ncbi:hypothetical protein QR680_002434 [Steinernema hermaphroditum]|uniref:Uncharacterized protein n=1 Tax=Steinernema hermaphroditum TaxID=289476 RepID=A0AA39H5E0_9BILA|nr:hypothetical protein QR680_002434 [Steinernema hermaphroditum]
MTLLRSGRGLIGNAFRFCSVQAQHIQAVGSKASDSFELFKQPQIVTPAFEFQRWAANGFSQYAYRTLVEKEYSKQGFLNGSNQAIDLAAQLIRCRNWERLRAIMTKKCLERVRESVSSISDEDLENKLKFSYENGDVVHSFLHSTILTGENIFRLSENGSFMFCGTVVSFINVSGTPIAQMSASKLAAHRDKLIVANVTICEDPIGCAKGSFVENLFFIELGGLLSFEKEPKLQNCFVMANLESRILDGPPAGYCSSSEDEGDSPALKVVKDDDAHQAKVMNGFRNTGVKGVLEDYRRSVDIRRMDGEAKERAIAEMAKRGMLSGRKEEEHNDSDLELDDDVLEKIRRRRLEDMRNAVKSNVLELESKEQLLSAIEECSMLLVIHLYENGCTKGVPAIQVYRKEKLIGNFIKMDDCIGDDFTAKEIVEFLKSKGINLAASLSMEDLSPGAIPSGVILVTKGATAEQVLFAFPYTLTIPDSFVLINERPAEAETEGNPTAPPEEDETEDQHDEDTLEYSDDDDDYLSDVEGQNGEFPPELRCGGDLETGSQSEYDCEDERNLILDDETPEEEKPVLTTKIEYKKERPSESVQFGISTPMLAYLLASSEEHPLEVKVDNIRFAGYPKKIESLSSDYPTLPQFVSVVFVLPASAPAHIVESFQNLSRLVASAVNFEQTRCHYFQKEALIMQKVHDEIDSHMHDGKAPFEVILSMFNEQRQDLEAAIRKIRPYHGIILLEETIPSPDANPALKLFLKHCEPDKRLTMAVPAEKQKFVTFMRERIHKDYEKYAADLQKVNCDIKEYSDLSVVLNKLVSYKGDNLKAKVDVGCNFFMQASIEKWNKIIVKLDNEYFAELSLERAKIFVEKKLELLRQKADRLTEVFNSIRAHDRLMVSLINELDVDIQPPQQK